MKRILANNFAFLSGLILTISMVLVSCEKGDPTDCFKNTGQDITERRSASPFSKIVLEDNINLVLTQSDEYSVSVRAGKNLLKKVKTDINDDVLTIKNNNTCNWMRSFDREITVYANLKLIHYINYKGSGDISCTNAITTDSLLLDVVEGAGKVEMEVDVRRNYIYYHIGTAEVNYSGYAHLSYISASSFGPIYAEDLSTVFTFIKNEGSNNCYIHAENRLEATIKNLGNIYYKGNPEIVLNDTGEGQLINNNE